MSEKKNYKVNQKAKTVTAYIKNLTDEEYATVEKYKNMGYKITLADTKRKTGRGSGVTNADLKYYLNDKIDDSIYNNLVKKIDNGENYLKTMSWLNLELKAYSKKNHIDFVPATTIVNVAKEIERETVKQNIENYQKSKLQSYNEDVLSNNEQHQAKSKENK